MNSVNMKQGIILKGLQISQREIRRIIPMRKSLTKKAKKVIESGVESLMNVPMTLWDIVKHGAQMMLQSALEEEVTIYLERDYYERSPQNNGRRNGSKPR